MYILSSFLSPHLQGIRRLRGQCRGFLLGRWLLFHCMVFNGSASSRKISRVRWENDEEVTGSWNLGTRSRSFPLGTFLNTDSYRSRIFRYGSRESRDRRVTNKCGGPEENIYRDSSKKKKKKKRFDVRHSNFERVSEKKW